MNLEFFFKTQGLLKDFINPEYSTVTEHSHYRQAHWKPQRGSGRHFREAPLKFFFEVFFLKWHILVYFIFMNDDGAPKRCRARGNLPPLSSPLDGPDYRKAYTRYRLHRKPVTRV